MFMRQNKSSILTEIGRFRTVAPEFTNDAKSSK